MTTMHEKLKQAGLATDDFTDDQISEIEKLSEATVQAIIDASEASSQDSTFTDAAGDQVI